MYLKENIDQPCLYVPNYTYIYKNNTCNDNKTNIDSRRKYYKKG